MSRRPNSGKSPIQCRQCPDVPISVDWVVKHQLKQTKYICKYLFSSLTHYFLLRFPIWIYSSDDHDYYGLSIHGNTGSKIGIDAGGPVVTPDTRSFDPDPVREQSCIDLLERVLPSVSNMTKQTRPCNIQSFFFSRKK